jgi:thymidine kinase
MAKLFFKYGTVFSAKSLNLIATAHNYETQGKKVLLMIPGMDTRSNGYISTRAGFRMEAEMIRDTSNVLEIFQKHMKQHEKIDCVLVDEVQMMTKEHVNQLREITLIYNTPVICYGLRVSYTLELFEASKQLLALADKLEEIKTVCWYCNSKATHNLKLVDGKPVYEGNPIDIGGLEKYLPVCYKHFAHPLI